MNTKIMANGFIFGKEVRLPDGRILLGGSVQHSIEKLSVAVNALLLEIDNQPELSKTFSEVPSGKPLLVAAAQPSFMYERRPEDTVPHVIIFIGDKEQMALTLGIEEELCRSLEIMCDIDVLEQHIVAPQLNALQNDLADMNARVVNNGIKDRMPGQGRNTDNTWKADQYQGRNRWKVRTQNKT